VNKHRLIGLVATALFACSGVSSDLLELPKIDRRPAAEK